jgi:hypothetical protein
MDDIDITRAEVAELSADQMVLKPFVDLAIAGDVFAGKRENNKNISITPYYLDFMGIDPDRPKGKPDCVRTGELKSIIESHPDRALHTIRLFEERRVPRYARLKTSREFTEQIYTFRLRTGIKDGEIGIYPDWDQYTFTGKYTDNGIQYVDNQVPDYVDLFKTYGIGWYVVRDFHLKES